MIGCQPANSPVMKLSVEAGKIVEFDSKPTLSDGSAGGVEDQAITFDICRLGIDKWIEVSEDEIKKAIYYVYKYHNRTIEGAAGVAVASFLQMVSQKNLNLLKQEV